MAETDPSRPSGDRAADDAQGAHVADQTVEERAAEDAAADRAIAERQEEREETRTAPVPPPAEPQPVLQPAEVAAPPAPKRQGNRLVGTAWVLLAAGLFEVLYFAALAGYIALVAGPGFVGAQLPLYLATPLAWLPVVFFFLLFELTVLISNRAGRFLYVVTSLVVGVLVYAVSVLLITILLRGDVGDRATLVQGFLRPEFVLSGLVAREVMLWTGVAIGARGTRVRKRNRAARQAYRDELAER